MPTLTAANAQIFLSVAGLFATPVQMQGFAADDVSDTESVALTETSMGVDRVLSGGFVAVPYPWGITFQADSPSISFFDNWGGTQKAFGDTLTASGLVILPSLAKKYTMTKGFLTGWKPIPDIKKLTQPQKFSITWQDISPQGAL